MDEPVYEADRSLKSKLRRRLVRLQARRPAQARFERPMVSFSFDDAPQSAASAGAAALERRGVHGTYFIAGGLAGTRAGAGEMASWADVRRLSQAGHEIACHTFSHLDCGQATGALVGSDLVRNALALADEGLPRPQTFAYPYGDVSLAAKRVVRERFAFARALHHGLIAPGADLAQAPAVSMDGDAGEVVAAHWIGEAVRRRGWLVLFTHAVTSGPTRFGMAEAALERLVDQALAQGAEVVTVAEGARRACA